MVGKVIYIQRRNEHANKTTCRSHGEINAHLPQRASASIVRLCSTSPFCGFGTELLAKLELSATFPFLFLFLFFFFLGSPLSVPSVVPAVSGDVTALTAVAGAGGKGWGEVALAGICPNITERR
eukprot:RCo044394